MPRAPPSSPARAIASGKTLASPGRPARTRSGRRPGTTSSPPRPRPPRPAAHRRPAAAAPPAPAAADRRPAARRPSRGRSRRTRRRPRWPARRGARGAAAHPSRSARPRRTRCSPRSRRAPRAPPSAGGSTCRDRCRASGRPVAARTEEGRQRPGADEQAHGRDQRQVCAHPEDGRDGTTEQGAGETAEAEAGVQPGQDRPADAGLHLHADGVGGDVDHAGRGAEDEQRDAQRRDRDTPAPAGRRPPTPRPRRPRSPARRRTGRTRRR